MFLVFYLHRYFSNMEPNYHLPSSARSILLYGPFRWRYRTASNTLGRWIGLNYLARAVHLNVSRYDPGRRHRSAMCINVCPCVELNGKAIWYATIAKVLAIVTKRRGICRIAMNDKGKAITTVDCAVLVQILRE